MNWRVVIVLSLQGIIGSSVALASNSGQADRAGVSSAGAKAITQNPPALQPGDDAGGQLNELLTKLKEYGKCLSYDAAGNVEFIHLGGSNATDEHLRLLHLLPHLKRVEFRCAIKNAASLVELSNLPQLAELNIYYLMCPLMRDDAPVLTGCHGLRVLTIDTSRIEPEVLAALTALPELRILRLRLMFDLTDAHIAKLRNLTELEELDVSDNPNLSDGCLDSVASLRHLKRLNLSRTKVALTDNEATKSCLGNLKNLEELDLSGNGNVTDASLEAIAALPSVKRLNVIGTKVTAIAISKAKLDQRVKVVGNGFGK